MLQKDYTFFNMNRGSKTSQVIEQKARFIIYGHKGGWVFTPRDLAALGDPRSVGMALTRLSRKGIIRQLARVSVGRGYARFLSDRDGPF